MAVHDGLHVRTRTVDLAVNEALYKRRPRCRIERIASEVILLDVGGSDQHRCKRTREQIAVARAVSPNADVAVAVQNSLLRKNMIGDNQIIDQSRSRLRSLRGRERRRYRSKRRSP